MYDSDSSDDLSLPPRPAIKVKARYGEPKKNTSPKSSKNSTGHDNDEMIEMDKFGFGMLDDYQQMQIAKMGDYLRWASLSSCVRRHTGYPSLCMTVADIFAILIFQIMKFDPQIPWTETNLCDQLIVGDGRFAGILWAALRECRAKGIANPQHVFCSAKSNLDGMPSFRNPWVIVSANERSKGLGASIGIALAKNRRSNGSKTFCLISDSSLKSDGSVWEHARMGALHGDKLNKLFLVISATSDDDTELTSYADKFDAFNWYTHVVDGHDMEELSGVFSTNNDGNSFLQYDLLCKIFSEVVKNEQKKSFKKIEAVSVAKLARKVHQDINILNLMGSSPTIKKVLQRLFAFEEPEKEDSYTMTQDSDFDIAERLATETAEDHAEKEFSSKFDEGKDGNNNLKILASQQNAVSRVKIIARDEFLKSVFQELRKMPVCIICKTLLGKGYKKIENKRFDTFEDVHAISATIEGLEKEVINLKRAAEGFRIKCKPQLYDENGNVQLTSAINLNPRLRLNDIAIDEDKIQRMSASFILTHFLANGMSNDQRFVMITPQPEFVRDFESMLGKRYINTDGCDPCSLGLGFSATGYKPVIVLSTVHIDHYFAALKMAAYSLYGKQSRGITVIGLFGGANDHTALGCMGMGVDDLALLRSLYGSSVVVPCDLFSYWKLLQTAYNTQGLSYVRSPETRQLPNIVYEDNSVEFNLGGLNIVFSTNSEHFRDQIVVCACGDTVWPAIQAAKYCQSRLNIGCKVLDVYTVKPIASFELKKAFGQTGKVMTVESHMGYGGLYSAVAEHVPVLKALRFNKPPSCDKNVEEVQRIASINKESIIAAIKMLCQVM